MGRIMESIRLAKEKVDSPPVISHIPLGAALNSSFKEQTESIKPAEHKETPFEVFSSRTSNPTPYEVCIIESNSSFNSGDFFSYRYEEIIKSQIEEVLTLESPISKDLLCKRVLKAWGIVRLGSRIEAYFDSFFKKMNIQKTKQKNNTIFWKGNTPDTFSIYRVEQQEIDKRDADDLPAEEVANGVREILRNQISLSQEDLIKEAASLFVYTRLGTNVENAMTIGIKKAIDRGYGYIENDRVFSKEI
jgi:hypothetical protein